MKNVLIGFVFFVLATNLVAQVSIFTKINNNEASPTVTIFGQKPINDNFSLVYFGLIGEYWAEAQMGLAWSPNTWSQYGLMAGIAQEDKLFRAGGFVWLGKDKLSSLILLEKGFGSDNYWYRVKALYQFDEDLFVGAQAWRFNGLGPLVEYRLKKINSTFWLFPAYDLEFGGKAITIGIDISI